MHDLVITGGTIVDGTGAPGFVGDVAVTDGRITHVGTVEGPARETIDATGLLVTPGFIDHHTHYDGQVTWDDLLEPSSGHGVTTIVTGNCGVGFAPVRPDGHQQLIELMEGVEDIPGSALAEGISWGWESFAEYLDVLDARAWSIDVATQIAHSAVRVYVMGDRGANNDAATAQDIAAMGRIVRDAVEAGALGFSTSRTLGHTTRAGVPVPGTFAGRDELFGIVEEMRRASRPALFEIAELGAAGESPEGLLQELDWMHELSISSGQRITYLLLQYGSSPELWQEQLARTRAANEHGAQIVAQVANRPFGMLIGFPSYHAFMKRPTFVRVSREHTEPAALAAALRDPAVKAAILTESDSEDSGNHYDGLAVLVQAALDQLFVLGPDLDYEPTPQRSVAALAAAAGREPLEFLYDTMLEHDAGHLLMLPFFNYCDGNHDTLLAMMRHPDTVLGLGDGGAHCALICDASMPTYLLSHWVRDRARGERIPVEAAVRMLSKDGADLWGLGDRGTVEVGRKADLNVIDARRIALERPIAVDDLPAGGRRLLQGAHGYVATVVNGVVTRRDGVDTGARPGRLVRGVR
jgi:N-acyl-D-aspartate/D-glutamate deacylase